MKQFKEAVYKNNLYAIVMYYGSIHAYETKFSEVLEAKRPHQITFSSKGHCLHILLNHIVIKSSSMSRKQTSSWYLFVLLELASGELLRHGEVRWVGRGRLGAPGLLPTRQEQVAGIHFATPIANNCTYLLMQVERRVGMELRGVAVGGGSEGIGG